MDKTYWLTLRQTRFANDAVLASLDVQVNLILRDAGNGAIGSVIIPLYRVFAPAPAAPTKP